MSDSPDPFALAVARIVRQWGDDYKVWHADGQFHATAKAGGAVMHAPSAQRLLMQITADFAKRHPARPCDRGDL